jgi:large subunit ribosomal protein L34e
VVIIRKIKKRAPTGKISIQLKKEKPRFVRCAICKKPLHGIPRKTPSQLKKLSKSKKRPSRAYGGYLCPTCLKELIRKKVIEIGD